MSATGDVGYSRKIPVFNVFGSLVFIRKFFCFENQFTKVEIICDEVARQRNVIHAGKFFLPQIDSVGNSITSINFQESLLTEASINMTQMCSRKRGSVSQFIFYVKSALLRCNIDQLLTKRKNSFSFKQTEWS